MIRANMVRSTLAGLSGFSLSIVILVIAVGINAQNAFPTRNVGNQRNEDAGAGILYSFLQAAEAAAVDSTPDQGDAAAGVMTDQEPGDPEDDDYLASHEYLTSSDGMTNHEEEHDYLPEMDGGEYLSDSSHEVSAGGDDVTVPDQNPVEIKTELPIPRKLQLTPSPRRLPPVRAPFLPNRPVATVTTSVVTPPPIPSQTVASGVLPGHKMNTVHDLDDHVAEHVYKSAEQVDASKTSTSVNDGATRVVLSQSVQTSRSTEVHHADDESIEEYSDELQTPSKPPHVGVSLTSDVKVQTSVSVRQSAEEMTESTVDLSAEVTYRPIDSDEAMAKTAKPEISSFESGGSVTRHLNKDSTSTTTTKSTATTTMPTVTTTTRPTTTVVTTQPSTSTTANPGIRAIFDKKTGRNITLLLATEDPEILAKLLPPTTPGSTTKKEETENVSSQPTETPIGKSIRTFVDKNSGKTMKVQLITEDPSILEKLLPPPRPTTTSKPEETAEKPVDKPPNVRVIFDPKTGKNITISLMTEDPSILSKMTPPTTTTTAPVTTTPAPVMYHPGIPQQSGKLPISTRHNVTRKPFLVVRVTTRNPRPPPTFKKISDILGRNKTSTRRPSYLNRQNQHEGAYQDDPDKRTTKGPEVSTTTIRTTTTLSPYFRWGPHLSVSGTMRLVDGVDWSDELRDPQSFRFKHLSNELEGQIDRLYRRSSIAEKYKGVQVESFSKGSVIVDYTLYLKDDFEGPIIQILTDSYRTSLGNESKLGIYKADPLYADFRVNEHKSVFAPPSTTEETQGFPHWAIATVGIGGASALFLLVLCLVMKCNKRATRRKYGSPLTDDVLQERKNSTDKLDKFDKFERFAAYDNHAANAGPGGGKDAIYGIEAGTWNEKKPRSRNGSLKEIYGTRSEGGFYDDGYSAHPYQPGQTYQNVPPTSYRGGSIKNGKGAADQYAMDFPPPKYYDAWDQWADVYDASAGRNQASGGAAAAGGGRGSKKDYDTTF